MKRNRTGGARTVLTVVSLILSLAFSSIPSAADEVWTGGVVAADQQIASRAGARMLELGGNAVDAAVATGFCLSVVRPYSCGIGGGGFLMIHLAGPDGGRDVAIDFRETAPASVGPDYFAALDDTLASQYGGHASGVPGSVAGLLHALEKYGTLDRATVLGPAIAAAEEGFLADAHYAEAASAMAGFLESNGGWKEKYRFTWDRYLHGGTVKEGDRIRVPEQAEALRAIASEGRDGFYTGLVGEAIIEAVHSAGGTMTAGDLARFRVEEREPLEGSFRGKRFLTMPPPSSGGVTLLQILGLFERITTDETPGQGSAAYVHALAECMKHAFADRAAWLGDPAFTDVPLDRLLGDEYLDGKAALFDSRRTKKPDYYGSRAAPADDGGTCHYSVVDRWGNAVAGTESINNYFGSFVAVPPYGFLLNNTMDDFTTRIGRANIYGLHQSDGNLPAPDKRPLSSMSPTIVLDEAGVFAVAGASGGPRIITGMLESLLNVLLFGMDPGEAVALRRFHHQWMPNTLWLEPGFGRDTQMTLFGKGHSMDNISGVGCVQLIRRVDGGYQAASDPRKGGRPAGLQ